MTKVTPRLVVDLIGTFPPEEREEARRDLAGLISPPHPDLSCRIQCRRLPVPVGLLEYALRYGSVASVALLLEAGIDPNDGTPRLLTQVAMAPFCRDEGRIEKLAALLEAKAETDFVERGDRSPPTPMIALARSKIRGIQRYWLGHLLREAGAPPIATNDYELHVMTRLLAELRAIGGIMECLPPAERERTKALPASYQGLVAAVLGSEDPVALGRLLAARQELKLPLDFDANRALAELSARLGGGPVSPGQAGFIRLLLDAGAVLNDATLLERKTVAPLVAEFQAIDGIVASLPPAQQAAIGTPPASAPDLLAAILHSEDAAALARMIVARKQGQLAFDFDATAALIGVTVRIADHPVSARQAGFVQALLAAGAAVQSTRDDRSAFETALDNENHELIDIFLEAGAKPDLASSPEMVFELMRRQGLPQLPKSRSGNPETSRLVRRPANTGGFATCG